MSPTLHRRGFTLVEIVVVCSIMLLLTVISFSAFSSMRERASLRSAHEDTLLTMRTARTNTLASREDVLYGVAFETNRIVSFRGSTYVPTASTSIPLAFPPGVTATTSLTGGVTTVTFARLTGEASATGTITFTNASGASSTVRILKTGLADGVE